MSTGSENKPIYLHIREVLRDLIDDGVYPSGLAIPSENELAEHFGTTRLTVRNAVDALVSEGLLKRVQGKGVYVCAELVGQDDTTTLRGFREHARAHAATPSVKVLSRRRREAGLFYAHMFGIDPTDELLAIKRINYVNGEPLAIQKTFIPLTIFPDIETIDVGVFSLYEAYRLYGRPAASAVERLDMVELGTRDAHLLNMEEGAPAISYECMSFDEKGTPIEYVSALRRGDRGGYTITFLSTLCLALQRRYTTHTKNQTTYP